MFDRTRVQNPRFNDGKREKNLRDARRTTPHGQVLVAIDLGHERHQQGPQGTADILRSPGADDPDRDERYTTPFGVADRLRQRERAAGLHPGEWHAQTCTLDLH